MIFSVCKFLAINGGPYSASLKIVASAKVLKYFTVVFVSIEPFVLIPRRWKYHHLLAHFVAVISAAAT